MRIYLSTVSLVALLSLSNAWSASSSRRGWEDGDVGRKMGVTFNTTQLTHEEHVQWHQLNQTVELERIINQTYDSLDADEKEAYKRAYVEEEKAKDPTFSAACLDEWAFSSFVKKSIRYDRTKIFPEVDITRKVNQIDPTLNKDRRDIQLNEGGRLGSLEIKRKEDELNAREEVAKQRALQELEQAFASRTTAVAEHKKMIAHEAHLDQLAAQEVAKLTAEEKKTYRDELFELMKARGRRSFPTRADVKEENILPYVQKKIRDKLAAIQPISK